MLFPLFNTNNNLRANLMQHQQNLVQNLQQQAQAQGSTPTQESGSSQQQQAHAHVRQGPTRLQFIVPGEQVDLYG